MGHLFKIAWAAPTTALGLAVVAVAGRRVQIRVVDRVIEAHGPVLAWALTHLTLVSGGVAALTLGHVVVGRDARALESTRAHERVHVRQYEIWGPAFLPAYALASLAAAIRGGHVYRDNWFEREAFEVDRLAAEHPPERRPHTM